jgi:LPXTG-site transpeptidase (sortase) family protein
VALTADNSLRFGRSDRLSRVLHRAGWTFIWLGLFTLGFVFDQLFVTTWLAQLNQGELDSERIEYFESAVVNEVEWVPTPLPESLDGASEAAPGSEVPLEFEEFRTLQVEGAPPEGMAFALLRIPSLPRLEDGWNVVEGVSVADLRNGAGHMPRTPLPGQPGNSVIAGHRTTYGAPFHELDELNPGDTIEVDTAIGTHTYVVRESIIVSPTDIWVTDNREGAWLTLTTCNPRFSARERLIIFAELVDGPNAQAILGAA